MSPRYVRAHCCSAGDPFALGRSLRAYRRQILAPVKHHRTKSVAYLVRPSILATHRCVSMQRASWFPRERTEHIGKLCGFLWSRRAGEDTQLQIYVYSCRLVFASLQPEKGQRGSASLGVNAEAQSPSAKMRWTCPSLCLRAGFLRRLKGHVFH